MRVWKLVGTALFALVLGSFAFFMAGRDEPPAPRRVPPFVLRDLAGQDVTDEVFAERRVTALVVWRPGIRECEAWLDAAGDIKASLPEGAGLVGLVVGRSGLPSEEEQAEARSLAARRTGAARQLVADEDLAPLLTELRTLPVTFFVDGTGSLVGSPIAGIDPRRIERELRALLAFDPEDAAARQRIHAQIFR